MKYNSTEPDKNQEPESEKNTKSTFSEPTAVLPENSCEHQLAADPKELFILPGYASLNSFIHELAPYLYDIGDLKISSGPDKKNKFAENSDTALNKTERRKIERDIKKAREHQNEHWQEMEALIKEANELEPMICSLIDKQRTAIEDNELDQKLKRRLELVEKMKDIFSLFGPNAILYYIMFCANEICAEMCSKEELRNRFFTDPSKDFTRDRKLPLQEVARMLLCMRDKPLYSEMFDIYAETGDMASTGAFVKQRSKLKPEGMKYFFEQITQKCMQFSTAKNDFGMRVLAADGSDINIHLDEDSDTCIENGASGSYSQYHCNAIYDVFEKMHVKALMQPKSKINEPGALTAMIRSMTFTSRTVIMGDRGYGSLNLFQTIILKDNLEFLIRVKESYITETRKMPLEEADTNVTIRVVTTQRNEDKERFRNGEAKYMSGKSKSGKYKKSQEWDYESETDVSFRIVRFQLESGEWETLCTSLSKEEFPIQRLKELYHTRWMLEGSFRNLKYDNQLSKMHSIKPEYALQEIYGRLSMSNICGFIECFAGSCATSIDPYFFMATADTQGRPRIHDQKLNHSAVVIAVCDFWRKNGNTNIDVLNTILKNKIPIRDGRHYKRNVKPKTFIHFTYR